MYRDPEGKVFPPDLVHVTDPEIFTDGFLDGYLEFRSKEHSKTQSETARGFWDRVPPRYQHCLLPALLPSCHSLSPITEQVERIAQLQKHPTSNYLFEGAGSCGKTHLLYSLYRHRLEEYVNHPGRESTPSVQVLSTNEWLNSVTAHAADHSRPVPVVTAAKIRRWSTLGLPVAIFLDEVDKFAYTPAKLSNLFDLVAAAYDCQAQIVMTSNLSVVELMAKWSGDVALHLIRRVGSKPHGRTLTFTYAHPEGCAA